jgi:serine protease AprX
MNKTLACNSANWRRRLSLLAALALLLPLVAVTPAQAPRLVHNIQPLLLQMADQQPEARVSIIVQKTTQDTHVEGLVERLGGAVTKDLFIINAFAAELPGRAVPQLAQAGGVRWVSLDAPVASSQTGTSGEFAPSSLEPSTLGTRSANAVVFTTWANAIGTATINSFISAANVSDSSLGPNNTFGYSSDVKGAFGGFVAQVTPDHSIVRVEVALRAYIPALLSAESDPKLTVFVGGVAGKELVLNHHTFDTCVGMAKACTVYVDVTSAHTWLWSDFDSGIELQIDQTKFASADTIYYDAIGLRVTSDIGTDSSGGIAPTNWPKAALDTSKLLNVYNKVVRATDVWNESPAYLQGQGQTVAVVDSGIFKIKDLGKRLIANVNFNRAYHDAADRYGHGTFVAGIVAGDGTDSSRARVGIAPKTNVINARVSDDNGMSFESDVVSALQWVYENKTRYNIKVVNLSLNSSVAQSYHTSPMDAACEVLWFNGIVVVVSAGNNGTATLYPPANDPFVITVGATDDKGTLTLSDDVVTPFSAYGTTSDGFAKPDLVAPGKDIIAPLPENDQLTIGKKHPANRVDSNYFRMSGTSMSAPMVSGAVALLLQDEPNLTPDQVKYRLTATANRNWAGYNAMTAGAGYLDIYAAVKGTTTQSANTGLTASKLLWTGSTPITWGSVDWNSVDWNSVDWNSVDWNSVDWNSVDWNSDCWEP